MQRMRLNFCASVVAGFFSIKVVQSKEGAVKSYLVSGTEIEENFADFRVVGTKIYDDDSIDFSLVAAVVGFSDGSPPCRNLREFYCTMWLVTTFCVCFGVAVARFFWFVALDAVESD